MWSEASRQMLNADVNGVSRPVIVRYESVPSVTIVVSTFAAGSMIVVPYALRFPFNVVVPVTVSALLTVVVPEPAPIDSVVAAPNAFIVVAFVLKIEAVVVLVVISALVGPLTARSPVAMTLLSSVIVPPPPPMLTVVAAPPIERVVTVELKRLPPVWVVVMSPPFTTMSLPKVAIPVPKKLNTGFVDALPKEIASRVFVVFTLM
jgi:hypothetical protein